MPEPENQPSIYFDFSPPESSANLEYELFNVENAQQLWDMFWEDSDPFISPKFKNPSHFLKYTAYQTTYARKSAEKGGCDYLFKNKQGVYLGVLHFYDLNTKNYQTAQASCTIGFATVASHRRTGLSTEAVRHLLQFAFEKHQMQTVFAFTEKKNSPAHAFLEKLGFSMTHPDTYKAQKYDYYELTKQQWNITY